jgi:hypothetical protein
MPRVGFQLTTPVSIKRKSVSAVDSAVTGIGCEPFKNMKCYYNVPRINMAANTATIHTRVYPKVSGLSR